MNNPKILINEDNSSVSDQKPYFLCMDSTNVPNPHNIGRNRAMGHAYESQENPTGICAGYDVLTCNNIYYRDCDREPGWGGNCRGYVNDKGEEIVYPCWWDNKTQKCGVDPLNNPKLGKDTAYPIDTITVGPNDSGKKTWDQSCFQLMGDPNCLYNNTDCPASGTATPDVYDALKCWVGKDGIPYTSNSNLMSDDERENRTVPLAYGDCSMFGSNCVPQNCGCGGWYNEARWGGGSKNCGKQLSCQNNLCKK